MNLSENDLVMKGYIQNVDIKLFQNIRIYKYRWTDRELDLLTESTDS